MEHRSSSRAYTVKMKKRSMAATVIVVLLSVVLIAGILVFSPIGDYLIEHAVQPILALFKGDRETDEKVVSALKAQEEQPTAVPSAVPTPVQNSLTVTETPFYLLQMGAFTEQDQAQEHADKIRSMGAAGYVFEDGSVYRVFAAAYRDEESLKKVQMQVRMDGFEATPYITDRNSVHLTLKGDKTAVDAVQKAVELLSNVPDALCEWNLSLDRQTIDGEEFRKLLSDQLNRVDEALREFDTIASDSLNPIVSVLQKYKNRISTFLQEHDTISRMNACDCKRLQIACIVDYISLFEQE